MTPEMRKVIQDAIASKPLEGEAYKRYLAKLGDKHERIGMVSSNAVLKLPKDAHLKQPFIDPTPRDWRHVSITEHMGVFDLVWHGSRFPLLPGDRRVLNIPATLRTECLTLAEAISNGQQLDALIKLKL